MLVNGQWFIDMLKNRLGCGSTTSDAEEYIIAESYSGDQIRDSTSSIGIDMFKDITMYMSYREYDLKHQSLYY